MSKGNMLLGHARGKVGDLVFSRSNGQQVVRARAAVVKNPKTELQTIQRIILNTVSQAYSKMQPIVNHSFEGVPEGQKSMSRFMRTNLDAIRAKVAQGVASNFSYDDIYAFSPVGTNLFGVNDFVIASGSLPSLTAGAVSGQSTKAQISLGGTTYGAILEALALQRGDQLTFVMIKAASSNVGDVTFHYARVILDPTSDEGNPLDLSTPLVVDGAINAPSQRNTGEFTSLAIVTDGTLTFDVGGTQRTCFAAGIIVSRKSNTGEWQRSNAKLSVFDSNVAGFTYSLQEALDFSAENSLGGLSDLYLNNAGTSKVAQSASPVFNLVVGESSTGATHANIVSFAYSNPVGERQYIMGVADDGQQYILVLDNSDSVYDKKCINDRARVNDIEANITPSPFSNVPSGFTKAWTNNDVIIELNALGYISTLFMATSSILRN